MGRSPACEIIWAIETARPVRSRARSRIPGGWCWWILIGAQVQVYERPIPRNLAGAIASLAGKPSISTKYKTPLNPEGLPWTQTDEGA